MTDFSLSLLGTVKHEKECQCHALMADFSYSPLVTVKHERRSYTDDGIQLRTIRYTGAQVPFIYLETCWKTHNKR